MILLDLKTRHDIFGALSSVKGALPMLAKDVQTESSHRILDLSLQKIESLEKLLKEVIQNKQIMS